MNKKGLYDPAFEHDSCGIGFVVNVNGEPSHEIVQDGITILKNLVHRGAVGGDVLTGDGAGLLLQIPHKFFLKECSALGFKLPEPGKYGTGMIFLPQKDDLRKKALSIITRILSKEECRLLGQRDVPVSPECLGIISRKSMPFIKQIFIGSDKEKGDDFERRLYILRKRMEKEAVKSGLSIEEFYIASLSSRTIVYKGMFVAPQLEMFFPDLSDKDFQSSIALVHQRYSTNTFPSWPLAQPFRYMAHNGEINTLRGNVNKIKAREKTLSSDLFGEEISKIIPIVDPTLSDSAILDNTFELLVKSGRSMEHSIMMMIPEPFGLKYHISQDKRAFYEYHTAIMEPWDGPAALVFSDGIKVGAVLDRNGLRPARYVITKSGKAVLASEVGVLDISPEDVLKNGRLAPGKMLIVDTEKKRVIYDNEVKAAISRQKPYRRWLEENRIELKGMFQIPGTIEVMDENLQLKQKIFGYTLEDIDVIIEPMAVNAQEPISSMGNDAALAVLSERPQFLYNYFKQVFAQVTNPPIDPYRENLVMSLMSYIGREGNLLTETPLHCHQLKLPHPVLSNNDMRRLRNIDIHGHTAAVLPMFFGNEKYGVELEEAVNRLCSLAEEKIENGDSFLILSDKSVNEDCYPIPALLAVSAVHQHLINCGKRQLAGLLVESGDVREVMHFAMLIGFGASAINPYLVFETISDLKRKGRLEADIKSEQAIENYITAIKKGLLKIMSKMGVSTIRSYRGAQIFEAVGLNSYLIQRYFPGTPSRIEGIGLDSIAGDVCERHKQAFKSRKKGIEILSSGGNIHYRRSSEKHLMTPEAVVYIQKAVKSNSYDCYRQYADEINEIEKNLCTLRGLFSFKERNPIPLDDVEPAEEIVKRFTTSAMSLGSISKEAHETIAIAMNRIGGMSNSGEGGENEERYKELENGDSAKSKVKQIASGRFGVTSNYLVNADELQIKMAQGAKPGEGGQLPGHKVNEFIAKVRNSTPGVMLISPPPHHDIYSIEDLAQLIFDLKNANPMARVSVKLVSEVGVGTIAAGVSKGKADMVLISGHDGGTGASPLSSVKHAGIPWEIGLADTHQTLVINNLRDRIRVQVDGQMRTGRDIVIAALLGAEEFGFGTITLVTMGCVLMRKCHLNTCPVGVATQDPELRKRFAGKPEYLINFMNFIAQDVREVLASLGFRSLNEIIGQSDLLKVDEAVEHWKGKGLDFSKILMKPEVPEGGALRCIRQQEHDFSNSLDRDIIKKAKNAIEKKEHIEISLNIKNRNRTFGATLSSVISRRYGAKGLPDNTIVCKLKGNAGQSFGAFLAPGVTLQLEGSSNDYLGKGLSGGRIILSPPSGSTFRPQNNIITGNVNLFGATSGEVYLNGMAGERFAVRNSGAVAVVEGIGDHGCEYMTGGVIVILGKTGINFAAGMSGGIAYVLDEDQLFDTRCNLEMVDIEPLAEESDKKRLHNLIQKHVKYTKSEYAGRILRDWVEMIPYFVKVMPVDYKSALERIGRNQEKGTEVVSMTEEVYN